MEASAAAEPIRIAVASNFANTAKALVREFEQEQPRRIRLVIGSSGKHYAQIHNGAPFHAYFSADAMRPERLESEGLIVPGSRFTYALGKLVLWSPDPALVDSEGKILRQTGFRHLAVANAKLAPYGRAAKEVLHALGLWRSLRAHRVRGENIGQTFHFVNSGNAELGFVAASQVVGWEGSRWDVPQELYSPVIQQAVLLKDEPRARAFLAFVRGEPGRRIIRSHGYGVAQP